jgi:uncharacterized membrane protein YphA (DoxX/SURF4 family)
MMSGSTGKVPFLSYLFFFLRIMLAVVFIFSSISKFLDIAGFSWALANLQLFSWTSAVFLSYAVPLAELVLGILLLVGLFKKFVLIHMGLFVIALGWISYFAWKHSELKDCNCLGKLIRLQYGIPHLILLGVLFLITAALFFYKEQIWSVDVIISRHKDAKRS